MVCQVIDALEIFRGLWVDLAEGSHTNDVIHECSLSEGKAFVCL